MPCGIPLGRSVVTQMPHGATLGWSVVRKMPPLALASNQKEVGSLLIYCVLLTESKRLGIKNVEIHLEWGLYAPGRGIYVHFLCGLISPNAE